MTMLNTDKINGANFNPIFGAKAWAALNLEASAFATLPKHPWDKSGWRIF